jgi:hypothetical protein
MYRVVKRCLYTGKIIGKDILPTLKDAAAFCKANQSISGAYVWKITSKIIKK